jgi:hypothetical protein
MRRNLPVASVLFLFAAATLASQQQKRPSVEVYKTATCGCCSLWVEHLEANGFTVRTTNLETLADIKAKHRIPPRAQSCHTAVVNGYVVEGHVPAADVQRLLKEQPAIVGLAVPGMPIGSPGMEVPGQKPQPFDVLAFDKTGQTRVFTSHNKPATKP